jgi:hypothetical protein
MRSTPAEIVRHLVGVQSQAPSAAALALATRTRGLTREDLRRAREGDRSIVLTWAMRGTLHLLAAEDYGWLLPLATEPRIANSHRRLRQLGLKGEPSRAVRAVKEMLERDGPLTRQEVLERLRRRRFGGVDERVAYHILFLAAAEGGACYGPSKGKDRCFVSVRDWIGEPDRVDRESALSELVVRYLVAHGPATPVDLASWAGIRLSDVRRGWRAVAHRLVEVRGPNEPLWTLRSAPLAGAAAGLVRLLPNFDEYLLGWKDRTFAVAPDRLRAINAGAGWLHPVVLADGRAVGTWKGERDGAGYRVSVTPFGSLSAAVKKRVAEEAGPVGDFLGTPATVAFGRTISGR